MFNTLREWWARRAQRKRVEWAEDHAWVDPAELAEAEERFQAPGGNVRGMPSSEEIPRAD